MKVEGRGKYAGAKVHLEKGEVETLIKFATDGQGVTTTEIISLCHDLGDKLRKLLKVSPKLLEDKSDADVAAALVVEVEKAQAKLAACKVGEDWKKIEVKVIKPLQGSGSLLVKKEEGYAHAQIGLGKD